MIRHSVILKLKNTIGVEEKLAFFDAVDKLKDIPDVKRFEVMNQISSKNKFEYGISMEFDIQEQYDTYTNHPFHVAFVQNFWIPNVEDFLEIDYTPYNHL
ncbi:Dabb family protein [Lacihabitans soyangensis]|uniref:Dabb family protein n=1 Tax=Lacihabitans soyangensis TaxID=869394 RepID=A0AAE3GZJ9_9BACT|nr:Dabb family protein [Lacihabitans soyangensis]MCP9761540.1 Dabb family protein [Lacihabitans soyangensis]